MLYSILGENIEGNESVNAEEDSTSEYKVKMQGLIDHMKYLMTFPDNEDLNIPYGREDYNPYEGEEIEYEDVDEEDLELLYKLCEAEAGASSEPEIGHVACVVLNRVKSSKFPNTIPGVIYQANQFACVANGHLARAVPSEKTKRAVDSVIAGGDTTRGAFWFRTKESAIEAKMPTSKSEKHEFYVYLFEDPNTHIFYTNYDYLGETVLGELEASANMVQAAEAVHKYVRENGYRYAQRRGITLPNYKTKTIDCSSYVTWVILNSGYRSSNYREGMGQWSSSTFRRNPEGWQEIKGIENARAGDILCYNGHVEIYAGSMNGNKPIVYNCGGNSSIAAKETSRSGHTINKLVKILRVP
ncbi:MAG: cell wall hydrolase [Clostridia bacterium]|nr:cell wall hydrolase [Clostridia bacterium]